MSTTNNSVDNNVVINNTVNPEIDTDPNTAVYASNSQEPVTPLATGADPVHSCSYLMAIVEAMQNVTASEYSQEAADAQALILDQNYEANIADSWNSKISKEMEGDMTNQKVQATVSQYQTEMQTYGNQADATTHGMQSATDTDANNLSNVVNLFSSVTDIPGYTASKLN